MLRRFSLLSCLLAALVRPEPMVAQSSPFFLRVEGSWTGQGSLAGQAMTTTAAWILAAGGSQALLLTALIPSGQKKPTFEGLLRIRTGLSQIGHWHDSQMEDHVVSRATLTPDSMVTHWTNSAGANGRSHYRLVSTDSLEILDYIQPPGAATYRLFGQYGLRRILLLPRPID
ncbi:MAG: hypothetical protein SFU84_15080 [Gemmatimonadales bacterium]|nr:hypothetical protein [Gemmatimonadales bacterium]